MWLRAIHSRRFNNHLTHSEFTWENDIIVYGEIKYSDGAVYEGDLGKNGGRDGKGTMKYANGAIYEGNWKDG